MIVDAPPGCSAKKLVTSYTLLLMINQQSVVLLCADTSDELYVLDAEVLFEDAGDDAVLVAGAVSLADSFCCFCKKPPITTYDINTEKITIETANIFFILMQNPHN